jgi:hypothetical protein
MSFLDNLFFTVSTQMEASLAQLAGTVTDGRVAVDLEATTVALPGTAEADIAASKTYLQALFNAITSSRLAVDLSGTVAGYLSTLAGAVALGRVAVDLATTPTGNLATLAAAITANRMAVNLDSTPAGNLVTLASAVSSGVMQAMLPDVTASSTLAILNDAVTVAVQGRPYVGFAWGAGTTHTVTSEFSYDGGTTWVATPFLIYAGANAATAYLGGTMGRSIIAPVGATHVRARVSTQGGGSCTATLRACAVGFPNFLGTVTRDSAQCVALASDDISLTYLKPATIIYDGSKNVTTAGTRVVLAASQALTRGVRVRGKDANTGLIYIGGTTVSSSSDRLAPGEPTWIDAGNFNLIYIDAAVSGEGVTYSGW